MRSLILGGARSGKSRFAEKLALDSGKEVIYIATGWAGDEEMADRIAHHRQRRPLSWLTVEEPVSLAQSMLAHAASHRCLIVDCLTLWLSNLLAHDDLLFQQQRSALLDILPGLPGTLFMISNEVGHGIVPANPLARRFVDEAGWLHQDLAGKCERVYWIVAGLPQMLKGQP